MKCVDCGTEIEQTKKEKELHATLHNPGNVHALGNVYECSNCKQHYEEEEEAIRLLKAFESDRLEQNRQKKK